MVGVVIVSGRLLTTGAFTNLSAQDGDHAVNRPVVMFAREQPRGGAVGLPVVPEYFQQPIRQFEVTVLPTLALANADEHA